MAQLWLMAPLATTCAANCASVRRSNRPVQRAACGKSC